VESAIGRKTPYIGAGSERILPENIPTPPLKLVFAKHSDAKRGRAGRRAWRLRTASAKDLAGSKNSNGKRRD